MTVSPFVSVQVQEPLPPAKVHPIAGEPVGGHTHAHVGFVAHAAGSAMQ
ncbi:MAG TPA: hypothetical protein VNM39_03395 [Verrucomicrobiae bacterium]|nr:hypothetical protein [Verrucomicrobiae bacterium]